MRPNKRPIIYGQHNKLCEDIEQFVDAYKVELGYPSIGRFSNEPRKSCLSVNHLALALSMCLQRAEKVLHAEKMS